MNKKRYNYLLSLIVTIVLVNASGCKKFLNEEPLGTSTDVTLFKDPKNAVLAVNAIYDTASWDEGPQWGSGPYLGNMYHWMFGDVLSDDAEKGSTVSDFTALTEMKEWRSSGNNGIIQTLWSHCYTGVSRANIVINGVDAGTIDASLKKRFKGEALFFRAYFYFYLARVFGGVPLFEKSVALDQFGKVPRNSLAETYAFIEKDLKAAIELLPEKNQYATADLGRATKGAATAYLARVIMYELGTDNTAKHTWKDVYDVTKTIINSNQYSLIPNYAAIEEDEGENSAESIFELQFTASPDGYGPIKTGTATNVFQNNRKTFGYGFNNPTQNLVNEFEPNDPRLPATVIKNGDIVLGIANVIDLSENATGYLNRKAAIVKPIQLKGSGQNIRMMLYSDVLLMNAEAAAHLNINNEAIDILNKIRARARLSTKPKGTVLGNSEIYQPNTVPTGTLPDVSSGLSGQPLFDAIYHERRVELAMYSIHYWDMIRTGKYMSSLTPEIRTRAISHALNQGFVNPYPVLPLPVSEVQNWGLAQNPGY